jgi:hypothetical protein
MRRLTEQVSECTLCNETASPDFCLNDQAMLVSSDTVVFALLDCLVYTSLVTIRWDILNIHHTMKKLRDLVIIFVILMFSA